MSAQTSVRPHVALPRGDIVVCGVGARTHAGLTALQATLAVRAGKMRPRASHLSDRHGEPIAVCRVASIGDDVQGLSRFVALASAPMIQATHAARSADGTLQRATPPLPVVLAIPSPRRPGFDARLSRELLPALHAETGISIDAARSQLVAADRGGGIVAFRTATALLGDGVDRVLVGGVDSYFDPDVLEWLDQERRLHGLETENGFIPGEAAAFVLLSRRSRVGGLHRSASLVGAAIEDEPRPYGSAEPCQALAMSHAIKLATGPFERTRSIPWVLTDVVNERHRVDEWQLAFARKFQAFTPDVAHDQPLLKTGDVGAASAALLVVMACVQWDAGGGRGDAAMVAAHSDGAERGVLLLAREYSEGAS